MAWLEQRPTSNRFKICFRWGGQQFKKTVKTTDRRDAEAIRLRLEENIGLVERGRLQVPPEADIATFLLSDGKVMQPPKVELPPKPLTLGELRDLYVAVHAFGKASVPFKILTLLSEFAKRTRYSNLDSLVAAPTAKDPLLAWHEIIEAIFAADVKDSQKKRILGQAIGTAEALEKVLIVGMRNLDRSDMDVADYAIMGPIQELAGRYAVDHLVCLLRAMREVLGDCVDRAHELVHSKKKGKTESIPYMIEFLNFTLYDRKAIRTKKDWS